MCQSNMSIDETKKTIFLLKAPIMSLWRLAIFTMQVWRFLALLICVCPRSTILFNSGDTSNTLLSLLVSFSRTIPPLDWSVSTKFYWRHLTPIWSNLGAGDERQEPWRDWGALPDWPGFQVRRWGFCKSEVGTQKNAVQWLLFKIVVLIFIVRFQILTGSDRGKTTSLQCRLACRRRSGLLLLSYRYSFWGMDCKCQNQLISIFKLW